MKKQIKFSICIPNYNYGKYIGETISSVINQNYQDFEIIVSDNNSSDNSIEVIKSFDDIRITLVKNKYNIGFIGNLNKVTKNASGDFIILLSSDDLMKQNALQSYYNRIMENYESRKEIFLMSRCEIIDSNSNIIGTKGLLTGDLSKIWKNENPDLDHYQYMGHYLLKELFLNRFQTPGQFPSMCFSRSLYEKVQGFSGHMSIYPDAYFSHKILFENPKVIYVNKFLFQYREHDKNNLSSINRFENIKSLIDPYFTTLIFNDKYLTKIGLQKKHLISSFVKNICLRPSLFSLFRGDFSKSIRILFFSISTYPREALSNKLLYLVLILIPLSPIFRLLNALKKIK
tara:strand:- start:7464 stop:8495 length:1032 start_codon:yes stop_codon:yes gene_type:complete